jgi:hypothetical protein
MSRERQGDNVKKEQVRKQSNNSGGFLLSLFLDFQFLLIFNDRLRIA